MQYQTVLFVVRDMEVSRRFYTGLMGMSVTQDFGANVTFDDRISLQTLATWTDFIETGEENIHFGGNDAELYFEEDDFDAFVERLKGEWPQVKIAVDVKEFPWGQRSIHFLDPDGHMVEVGENMKTVVKRYLRQGMTLEQAREKFEYTMEFLEMCRDELAME